MIIIGDRVFYLERRRDELGDVQGFGLVVDLVVGKSIKFPAVNEKSLRTKVFVILKDNGELEEFLEFDLKKLVDI